MARSEAAARHQAYAARFATLIDGVTDWAAPTPVREWTTRDVASHLIEWLPGFLSLGSTVTLPAVPAVAADPAEAWRVHAGGVQAVLDDPGVDRQVFHSRMFDELPLAAAIDQFYTTDVFLHSWDLARASGQDDTLDEGTCAQLLAGMQQMREVIRQSGQFGDQQPVGADAGPQEHRIAFIGRDPHWRP